MDSIRVLELHNAIPYGDGVDRLCGGFAAPGMHHHVQEPEPSFERFRGAGKQLPAANVGGVAKPLQHWGASERNRGVPPLSGA
jgi:hypothetical protein